VGLNLAAVQESSSGAPSPRPIPRCSRSQQVIITTHAMEEAEALCSRIGIMIQASVVDFVTALGSMRVTMVCNIKFC
jgi:hypothetical protein